MTDDRYKQLMEQVGMPNSRSLLVALQQVANEVAQETAQAERDRALSYYGAQTARLAAEREKLREALATVVREMLPEAVRVPGQMRRLGHPWPLVADALDSEPRDPGAQS